ncbi:MAG TPA: sodium:proton antiporter [Verrucomicrobiae bacterium]|nr:sodium:proton antiporter [Verrucomicrobiae bacterium]
MHEAAHPSPWMIAPFGLLLALIALAPVLFAKWWARHYPKIALGLGAITLFYYLAGLRDFESVKHAAIEYAQFIALVGSLYVVAGGIHISVKGEATPGANVVFLLVGALLANVLGTTGASMLLIRPWIRMNKYRVTAHHVVFFIFIVSNVGGCLTPIGDPPLFLGFLKGIPFWWVAEHCWPMWLAGTSMLLAMFYVVDRLNYARAPKSVRDELAEPADEWRFEGLPNLFFLAVILVAVFINNPPFLREGLMVLAALGSWFTTRKEIHTANHFDFHPLEEVALLFAGIFATMMPALAWLRLNASQMGDPTASLFYWGAGVLSSVLDNAPTYLSFLYAAIGKFVDPEVISEVAKLAQTGGAGLAQLTGAHAEEARQTFLLLQKHHAARLAGGTLGSDEIAVACLLGNPAFSARIVAISVAAVFFGANTYIGNGPNFMVKSIADQQRVRTPDFLGYVFRFTLPIMLPMLVVIWWFWFR